MNRQTQPHNRDPGESVDDHGAQVQEMFERIAPGYDRANRWMSLGVDVRWRRRAVAGMLPADSQQPPAVLDLCAGTLDSSLEIHRRYPRARIIAGDFSAGMLERGRAKLVGRAAEHIEPRILDAHALPMADASLDAVFCAFGVRNLSDLPRATREQARCLRRGGVLTVLEFFRPSGAFSRLFHAAYNRTVLPLVGWAASGDRRAYRYLPRSMERFVALADYLDLLEQCGFGQPTTRRLSLGIAWLVRAIRR